MATPILWPNVGATTTVSTEAGLNAAIAAAGTGDTILLADGNYDLAAFIAVNKSDIRIKSQNPKGAVIRGRTTGPTTANQVLAHLSYGFKVTGHRVFIEDLYFKWLEVGIDFSSLDDIVCQGCRFESNWSNGLIIWDCVRPRIHMCEFLDPYLSGDTGGTLTAAGSVTDGQADYGVAFWGNQDPKVTHCYFKGNHNQCCSFKEGNRNAYAGYNTFEGALFTALFFGQNGASNGPYARTGIPVSQDAGDAVAEFNVFRPIIEGGKTHRMNIAMRAWHMSSGSMTFQDNVIEAAISGIQFERQDTGDAGTFTGKAITRRNTIGGSWRDSSGVIQDVASAGLRLYKGISLTTPAILDGNAYVYHIDPAIVYCYDAGQGGSCPTYIESNSIYHSPPLPAGYNLRAPVVAFDPDLSFDATPSFAPSVSLPLGDEFYGAMTPLVDLIGDPGGQMKNYCFGIVAMMQPLDDLVKDGPNGEPGWSQELDLNRAKNEWLQWLGQWVGYQVPNIHPQDDPVAWGTRERARIVTRSAHRRGTIARLRETVQEHLVDPKQVIIQERTSSAHQISVWIFNTQIATSAALAEAAARAEKAAGLIMTFTVLTGANYNLLQASNASYTIMTGKHANYNSVLTNPGL